MKSKHKKKESDEKKGGKTKGKYFKSVRNKISQLAIDKDWPGSTGN